MTSNDRHATHDSPYRTGQHVPLNQSRHAPLTSVATDASESRPDLSYDENDLQKRPNGWPGSPGIPQSPGRPYSPGMRSLSSQKRPSNENTNEVVSPGEIQMQSFHDGAPPPPPAAHSWKKIDHWAEQNYEELFDQLGEGCTQNDINELEHELDCSLPMEVRESLAIHDGQERGGTPTGIIFGCMLLDCEEIVQEWKNWRTVNDEYLSGTNTVYPQYPSKAFGGSSSASTSQSQQASNPLWRQELLERQESQPPKAIQKAYAHPSWIPLARDWGGNNIAIDLAPGPMGKWGQVIIFGRDYDCKYVIARSWAAFLAVVADDITSEKVFVDEETGELKLKEFKTQTVEPPYIDILRWRSDQKYGPRGPRRKAPGALNTSVKRGNESPYNSPTMGNDERGRSPQRFPSRGPASSPKGQHNVSSPLARVTEEMPAPVPVRAGGDIIKDFATMEVNTSSKPSKLVDVGTPTVANDERKPILEAVEEKGQTEEKREESAMAGLGVGGVDEMKNVQI
ncbi:MAG: hypothetical protein Q9160_002387 [Pyrenula sp. 1 TL-2023]